MKTADAFAVVLVTAPAVDVGRILAQAMLEARLAACVNIVPGVESHYWWEGKIDASNEVLLVIKTTQALLPELEKLVLSKHPYDTPEFLVLPLIAGTERYLQWLASSVRSERVQTIT